MDSEGASADEAQGNGGSIRQGHIEKDRSRQAQGRPSEEACCVCGQYEAHSGQAQAVQGQEPGPEEEKLMIGRKGCKYETRVKASADGVGNFTPKGKRTIVGVHPRGYAATTKDKLPRSNNGSGTFRSVNRV
jgi:hypothetical protein